MEAQVHIYTLLAGVGFISAAPTPDTTVDKGASAVTATLVPIDLPPVPLALYPDSPSTSEFQHIHYDDNKEEDKKIRTAIHNAFANWPAMMQKALQLLRSILSTSHRDSRLFSLSSMVTSEDIEAKIRTGSAEIVCTNIYQVN